MWRRETMDLKRAHPERVGQHTSSESEDSRFATASGSVCRRGCEAAAGSFARDCRFAQAETATVGKHSTARTKVGVESSNSSVNRRLAELNQQQAEALESQLTEVAELERQQRVLASRELSFCLFERDFLVAQLQRLARS